MVEPRLLSETQQDCIRVLVADDYAVVRYGLEVFLLAFEDLELVGMAVNGEEAVRLCGHIRPDVVLMDVSMPIMDGVTATRLIRQQYPETQVIALVSFEEEELAQRALEAGAFSYLVKNASIGELADTIRAASAVRPTRLSQATPSLPVEESNLAQPVADSQKALALILN
jgi:DNA-binding NarL/FixJ family response regulator